MPTIWIVIIVIAATILVPIWLYFITYMMESARLNARRDWQRDNGRQ